VSDLTYEQAIERIEELEAENCDLRSDLDTVTDDRDLWSDLVDDQEAELDRLRFRVEESEHVAPVVYRAASIRDALDAIPAELRRDPRWQFDFQTLTQFVHELAG